jgi:predicted NBD/HSP70 family sugar kinase
VEFSFDHVDDIPLHDREWLEDLLAHAGTSLGVVIGNVCNLLNPQMVVLGGPLVTHSDTYFERARAAAREHILPDFAHQIAIRRSELGDRANAVGAAALALERLLFVG